MTSTSEQKPKATAYGARMTCSTLSRLNMQDPLVQRGWEMLRKVCGKYPESPDDLEDVARGLSIGLRAAVQNLKNFGTIEGSVVELQAQIDFFSHHVAQVNLEDGVKELALMRNYSTFPQWKLFGYIGRNSEDQCEFAALAAGLLTIQAASTGRCITKELAHQLSNHSDSIRMTLSDLAHQRFDECKQGMRWLLRLSNRVPAIFNIALIEQDFNLTAPSPASRMQGQLYSATHFATPGKRAGALTKAELSDSDRERAVAAIRVWLEDRDPRGSIAVLAVTAGVSLDLVAKIRLGAKIPDKEIGVIDVPGKVQIWDFRSLIADVATPLQGSSCVPADLVLRKPLPASVADELCRRLLAYQDACRIQDLYPNINFKELEFHEAFPARSYQTKSAGFVRKLRMSLAQQARREGFDSFLAGAMTNDFGFICRSKFHYAVITSSELTEASSNFFKQAKWGDACNVAEGAIAFGCSVVPTEISLAAAGRILKADVSSCRPTNRTTTEHSLIRFHNSVARACAFELMMLFALRACKYLPLKASLDEDRDLFMAFVDKKLPGRRGAIPMILTARARQVIGNWRLHCAALADRLLTSGCGATRLYRWLRAVVERKDEPLFQIATSFDHLARLGSSHVIHHISKTIPLPADFGRKWAENHLRKAGQTTACIDAVLRHEASGIEHYACTSNFSLMEFAAHIGSVIDAGMYRLFGAPISGMSRRARQW